jgi:HAD superfamily hydrolase (TIGR01509 family)
VNLLSFRAAIFDLDGTLVISEPAWEAAKRRVLGDIGVSVTQDIYDEFVGRGLRGFLARVIGPDLTDDLRADLIRRIEAEADSLLPQMRRPFPGAAAAVRRLATAGLRVAVCSSSPRRHIHAALEQLDLDARTVEIVVSGAELPRGKPDPLPYRETLRHLNLGPAQAFAVEDALPGAQSAHAAGLAVVGIGADSLADRFAPYCRVRVLDYGAFGQLMAPAAQGH